jgi:FG-GAP repeat protein
VLHVRLSFTMSPAFAGAVASPSVRPGIVTHDYVRSLRMHRGAAFGWLIFAALSSALLFGIAGSWSAAHPLGAPTPKLVPGQLQSVVQQAIGGSEKSFTVARRAGLLIAAGGGITSTFSESGVRVGVAGGTIDLRLSAVGLAGRLGAARVMPIAAGNVVRYERQDVVESYLNGPLGLEQTFVVAARPQGAERPLTLALSLGGSLVARQSGADVIFVSRSGRVELRYGGLNVVDATGRHQRAAVAVARGKLRIRVWDHNARYPLHIDPLIQQGPKLTADDEAGTGRLGTSVALSSDGNTALVGGETDNNSVGAAWVFTRSGSTWTQQGSKLTANDETGPGNFGHSVTLSADGNTALIGGQADNNYFGAAWVFTRSGSIWTQQGPKLLPDDAVGPQVLFGQDVSVSADGHTALVSGSRDNNYAGAAWVFTQTGAAWTQYGAKLTANDESGSFVSFGYSATLSADGSTALIGGNGDANNVGAAWIFTPAGSAWAQQGPKLTATDETGPGNFGGSVALSSDGSTALIGGYGDDNNIGAAWAFTRSGASWTQQGSRLSANDETGQGSFGSSIAVAGDGNTALIGGPGDNGVTGAAWVFTRSSSAWAQQGAKLTGGGEVGAGVFGIVAIAADGNTALIGGPGDTGGIGAAWPFAVNLPTSADQCKDGGWKSFGVFKNQGDCVSYVATDGGNPPG